MAVGQYKSAPFHQDWICENQFIRSLLELVKTPKKAISAGDYMPLLQRKLSRGWASRERFSNMIEM